MSENKPLCTTDDVQAAHFSGRKAFPEGNSSLAGFPPSATNGFDTGTHCFSLKRQLRCACSYSVTTRFSLALCKCLYFCVSCRIQNGKLLLRDVQRTLLFQQKRKETHIFVPLYPDPLTKERKLSPDTSNFKTHTHKENPPNLFGKKTSLTITGSSL